MAYNRNNYAKLKEEYSSKNLNAKKAAEERENELHSKYPDIKEIDSELRLTGCKILKEAFKGKEGLDERISALKEENRLLQKKRAQLLKKHGIPADYTDVKYECNICMDTGFVGTKICDCFKKALNQKAFEDSGLGALLKDQSFDSFNMSYYLDDKAAYENNKNFFQKCKDFSENFGKQKMNLLIIGGTGVGKTHLSTSIAREVIEKGFDVVYDSAANIFNDFNKEQFKSEDGLTDKYFNCDMLIIDDLGSEMTTAFTISCLYNLLNTRLNSEKCMIINSNLAMPEITKRYTDRITSRLLGHFEPMLIKGSDIRLKKLKKHQ